MRERTLFGSSSSLLFGVGFVLILLVVVGLLGVGSMLVLLMSEAGAGCQVWGVRVVLDTSM